MTKSFLKEELRSINDELFELQYEKNGLYGYSITYRLVTDNQSFQVKIFHHGNPQGVRNIRSTYDLQKLKSSIFDL